MLQVDNREDQKILKYLEKENIEYTLTTLKVGDYFLPEKNICVERKTIFDFVESYCSSHLKEQLENMTMNFDIFYLFISGYYNYFAMKNTHYKYINEQSVGKMKIHLTRNYPGLRIVEFSNDHQLALGIKEIILYEGTSSGKEIIRRVQKGDDIYLSILCALPGISIIKARKIQEKYPCLNSFIEAVKKDEKVLQGLGLRSKEGIKKAIFG